MTNAEFVAQALRALGAAYRGDWGDFDGRTLRAQLEDVVGLLADPTAAFMAGYSDGWLSDPAEWLEVKWDICREGGDHWRCGSWGPCEHLRAEIEALDA